MIKSAPKNEPLITLITLITLRILFDATRQLEGFDFRFFLSVLSV